MDKHEEEIRRAVARRIRMQQNLTSGCGYGETKRKYLDCFWSQMWPSLEKLGWRKRELTGNKEGSIQFFIPGSKDDTGRKGKEWFGRIKDVIDKVTQNPESDEEKAVAHTFLSAVEKFGKKRTVKVPDQPNRRAKPRRVSLNSPMIDVSWKEGGSAFPKQVSRVGENYQVASLPQAGSYKAQREHRQDFNETNQPSELCEQLWDPVAASKMNATNFIHEQVNFDMREFHLDRIHKSSYKTSGMANMTLLIGHRHWSNEERAKFHKEILRLRKDMHAIAHVMNKSVSECYAYYLTYFKKSDDYRITKIACQEDRASKQTAAGTGFDACSVCGNGGNLLICDGCETEYHLQCLNPPLADIPEGHWECDVCVNKKFLDVRERVMSDWGLCEEDKQGDKGEEEPEKKKQKAEDTVSRTPIGEVSAPSLEVANLLREFATSLETTLSSASANKK